MIHKAIPKDFNPRFEIVSCYLEHDNHILLLHRHLDKSQGDKWGVPAGKVEKGEKEIDAMVRELEEETGLVVLKEELNYFTKVYVRYSDYDFLYHMFHLTIPKRHSVILSENEHQAFSWVSPQHAVEKINLVQDLDECIKMFYN